MIAIGIDPGKSGGIAAILTDGTPLAWPMPETEADICEMLRNLLIYEDDNHNGLFVHMEHVWSTPGQGGAFAFGKNNGVLLGILTALRMPFELVLPRTWQKKLGIAYPSGSKDTDKKNITKRRAQQLFPMLTISHKIADSLLLAEHCRRTHKG